MMTDDEMLRQCHAEIRRLRGVIREMSEAKRYVLVEFSGKELKYQIFEDKDEALSEMKKIIMEKTGEEPTPADALCADAVITSEKGGRQVTWGLIEVEM